MGQEQNYKTMQVVQIKLIAIKWDVTAYIILASNLNLPTSYCLRHIVLSEYILDK